MCTKSLFDNDSKEFNLYKRVSNSYSWPVSTAKAPSNLNLCFKMSYKSAYLSFECPDGNITIPESPVSPLFNLIDTEVGIPSGYLSS